jgi:predicted YcjX-like family ATPase
VNKDFFKKTIIRLDSELREQLGSARALYKEAVGQTTSVARELYQTVNNRRVRLAVTGLSRSGKSVFITSLINQLLEASQQHNQLIQLRAVQQGRYLGAREAQQPDSTVPTFRYDEYRRMLLEDQPPQWPEGTRDISQIRLHIRTKATDMLDSRLSDFQNLYLDIIDYPGEWLVDLPMLELSFAQWSEQLWRQAEREDMRDLSATWRDLMAQHTPQQPCDRRLLERLHRAFQDYLLVAKARGYEYLQPGRFLLPGMLAGSPAVTFCPCREPAGGAPDAEDSLYRQLEARFEMYKKDVIKPFYRDHFARFDCQVVLVDLMYALQQGRAHFDDTQKTLYTLLNSFRHGRSNLVTRLISPKIDRILFAVTKVDQVNRSQYQNLQKLLDVMLLPATRKAEFSNVRHTTLALASLKATETVIEHDVYGQPLEFVRGRLSEDDFNSEPKELFYPPGAVPNDLPTSASWQEQPFSFYTFHPPALDLRPGQSMPHINMDKALDFLIGDKL